MFAKSFVGRAALLCVVLASSARAGVPVALYPVQGKVEEKVRRAADALLEAGIEERDRLGSFVAQRPLRVPGECGTPPMFSCLVTRASRGVLVVASVAPRPEGDSLLTMVLVTADGRQTKPVRFAFSADLQDLRTVHQAFKALEAALPSAVAPVAPNRALSMTANAPGVDPASAAAQLEPKPRPDGAPTATVAVTEGAPRSGWIDDAELSRPIAPGWVRPVGLVAGGVGLAAIATGAVFGLQSRGIHEDLSRRYTTGELVVGDRAKYDQVRQLNLLANTLFAAGGALAGAGGLMVALSFDTVQAGRYGGGVNVGGKF